MSQPISDFDGDVLYLDTTTFYLLLRAIAPDAQVLFDNIQRGTYQAFTSALTFDELAYRMLLALIRDRYGNAPLDRLRQDEQAMVTEFYPQLEPILTQLQTYPNLTVLDVTSDDLLDMHQNMLRHHLLPRDALHLAAMRKCGCLNIVSQDDDFDSVSGVERYTLS